MNELLRVEDLTKSFDETGPVVDSLSFEIREDEIFALLGPSGCGKTTCLRLIAGFERADRGEVWLEQQLLESPGRHRAPQDRGIGFVFQDYALFPHLSVIENVAFGLTDIPKYKRSVYAEEVLCRTGMEAYKHRNPGELSGGQQQRVALARAIAPKPKLVLLDEPFSNLDAILRDATRKEVRSLLKKAGMSALLVTHDQEEALSFADRIAVMNNGRIEQVGKPEDVYYQPKTQFVAQFLGRTNLFRVDASGSREVMSQFGKISLDTAASGKVLCSIRPEHLTLEKATGENGNSGVILSREFKGHDITYHVLLNGEKYLVHTDNRVLFENDEKVVIKPLESAVVLQEDV